MILSTLFSPLIRYLSFLEINFTDAMNSYPNTAGKPYIILKTEALSEQLNVSYHQQKTHLFPTETVHQGRLDVYPKI